MERTLDDRSAGAREVSDSGSLIPPYGGTLVDLVASGPERDALLAHAATLLSVQLSDRSVCDLELLATGAFSPLTTFLGEASYRRVLDEKRLADGTLWPIPITLPVPASAPIHVDAELALRSPKNDLLAVMTVREAWRWDRETEAAALLGRADPAHPLVAEMARWGEVYVSGPLRVLNLPAYVDFRDLRRTPRQVREALTRLGSRHVVAFQTRNPLHRSHEELTKRAAAACGGTLLIHPVVGMTKPGDVDHYTRVRSYRVLAERYYDPARTLLSLLPLAMRMAGPREALWHAIIRRNFGASHFIIGRDHAGPGPGSDGKPFFGPYEAQEALALHAGEIGVTPVPFHELVYLPDEDRFEETDRVPAGTRTLALSGTQVRAALAKGEALPEWFTRPETAAILSESSPPAHRRGFCVWFTGLSGSGKTTTAEALIALLFEKGRRLTVLDGDVVRTHLSKGLGFSREDRDANIRRIGFVAAEIVRHGGAVLCAAVSPYAAARAECRELVGADQFLEVFVDTPIEVCEARDAKGLYAQARQGLIKGFTGVDDPYEAPTRPELRLDTVNATAEANARAILAILAGRGFVRP